MHGYWQSMPPLDVKAGILADWCDHLQDWTLEQVVWALRKWRDDNPDKRPNPGHISGLMKRTRGEKIAATMPREAMAQERKRITAEEANAILEATGFNLRRMTDATEG